MPILDSGKREEFSTGAVRDTQENKPRYDLIPISVLERLAVHYGLGAQKYATRNWQKGQPISRYYASLQRHLMALIKNADDEEDHAAAVIWNAVAVAWTIEQIEKYNLPSELDDREEML